VRSAGSTASAPAFELSRLTKTFYPLIPWHRHRAVAAVRELNLKVPRGIVFSLLGPNGAGKTTTIKLLAGLILPTQGAIRFFDVNGRRLPHRPRIGAVLEGSRNVYWRLSPMENLYYFGELNGIPRSEIRRQGTELLAMFELADRAHSSVQTLSRGMQQKVAIALALLGDPDLLLLDEPTLGLDVESARLIRERLRHLVEARGKTIVLTTHQMELAAGVADRIGIMQQGRLVAEDRLGNLIKFFRKQDYELELPRASWAEVKPLLSRLSFSEADSEEGGYVLVTFHLKDAREFYELIAPLKERGVPLRSVRQVTPTLEDVFVEITRRYRAEDAGAGSAAMQGGEAK